MKVFLEWDNIFDKKKFHLGWCYSRAIGFSTVTRQHQGRFLGVGTPNQNGEPLGPQFSYPRSARSYTVQARPTATKFNKMTNIYRNFCGQPLALSHPKIAGCEHTIILWKNSQYLHAMPVNLKFDSMSLVHNLN